MSPNFEVEKICHLNLSYLIILLESLNNIFNGFLIILRLF